MIQQSQSTSIEGVTLVHHLLIDDNTKLYNIIYYQVLSLDFSVNTNEHQKSEHQIA